MDSRRIFVLSQIEEPNLAYTFISPLNSSGGYCMILHPESSSSSRKPAINELVGAGFPSNCAPHMPGAANPQDRLSSAMQMRHRLYMLDPSERRMSIEECVAAVLERSSNDLPA